MVAATKDTWSNSRRKRRAEKSKHKTSDVVTHNETSAETSAETPVSKAIDNDSETPAAKRLKIDSSDAGESSVSGESKLPSCEPQEVELSASDSSDEKPLIRFSLELKLDGIHIILRLRLMDGERKDKLHQILQYFKNRLI